jgi:hypothetical protein
VKAKIADDMNHLKVNVAHAKHEHDVKRAETAPPARVGGRVRHRLRHRGGRTGEAGRS